MSAHWTQGGPPKKHVGFIYAFGKYVVFRSTTERLGSYDTEAEAIEAKAAFGRPS